MTCKEGMFQRAVETPVAVANLPEILCVEGLDGIFIGPMDLSTSMGHFCGPAHPEVQTTIREIERMVLASGKILATIANSWDQAKVFYDRGYQLLVMADGTALVKMAADTVAKFMTDYPEG